MRAAANTEGRFGVGTLNVWGDWAEWPDRLDVLAETWPRPSPDVLFLQEVVWKDGHDQAAEIAARLGYEYITEAIGHATPDGREGVAILSRLPLRDARAIDLPEADPPRRACAAELAVGDSTVTVICAHTVATPEAQRMEQVHALLSRPENPLVIGGDLNEPPGSVSPLLDSVGLVDALADDPSPTWPMSPDTFELAWAARMGRVPHFSLEPRRLDYLLVRGLEVEDGAVVALADGDRHASDHALVVAWLRLPRSRPLRSG